MLKRTGMIALGVVGAITSLLILHYAVGFILNAPVRQASAEARTDQREFNARMNSYFVAHYIRNRESYSKSTLYENYNIVRLMSAQNIFTDFMVKMRPQNADSNIGKLGDTGTRAIKFRSVTFPEPQLAEAHFLIDEKSEQAENKYPKVARIKFEYVKMSLTAEEQLLNPLGFRVLNYSLTDDTP